MIVQRVANGEGLAREYSHRSVERDLLPTIGGLVGERLLGQNVAGGIPHRAGVWPGVVGVLDEENLGDVSAFGGGQTQSQIHRHVVVGGKARRVPVVQHRVGTRSDGAGGGCARTREKTVHEPEEAQNEG